MGQGDRQCRTGVNGDDNGEKPVEGVHYTLHFFICSKKARQVAGISSARVRAVTTAMPCAPASTTLRQSCRLIPPMAIAGTPVHSLLLVTPLSPGRYPRSSFVAVGKTPFTAT